jgi:DNA-binding response OmpR family regulator
MLPDHNGISDRPRILLVDDDQRLLDGYTTYLTAMGYHCVARNNVSEAMVQFETGSFDLVITDLTMPDIDGLGVLAMIRSQGDVPILILTGHAFDYGRSFLGFDNVTVVAKPLEPVALMQRVSALLCGKGRRKARVRCG